MVFCAIAHLLPQSLKTSSLCWTNSDYNDFPSFGRCLLNLLLHGFVVPSLQPSKPKPPVCLFVHFFSCVFLTNQNHPSVLSGQLAPTFTTIINSPSISADWVFVLYNLLSYHCPLSDFFFCNHWKWIQSWTCPRLLPLYSVFETRRRVYEE